MHIVHLDAKSARASRRGAVTRCLFLFIIVVSLLGVCEVLGDQFVESIGGGLDDEFNSAIRTSDGNVVAVGYTSSFGYGLEDALIAKLDPCGKPIWKSTMGTFDHDFAYSVVETYDNGYVLVGSTVWSTGNRRFLLISKYAGTGDDMWTRTIIDTGAYREFYPTCVIEDIDHNLVVTGHVAGQSDPYDSLFLTKFSPSGEWIAGKCYGTSDPTKYRYDGRSLVQALNGDYIVVGSMYNSSVGQYILLARFDSDLNYLSSRWMGEAGGYGEANQIIRSSEGGYVVVGRQADSLFIDKRDSNLNPVWQKTTSNGQAVANSVDQASDGSFVLTGQWQGYALLAKTDPVGTPLWSRGIGHWAKVSQIGRSIVVMPDSSFLTAGTSTFNPGGPGGASMNGFVAKLDSTGHACMTSYVGPIPQDWNPPQSTHSLNQSDMVGIVGDAYPLPITDPNLTVTNICSSPFLTIQSPDTESTFCCRTEHEIVWRDSAEASLNLHVKFRVSIDGIWSDWTSIDNTGSCAYMPPCVLSGNCLLVISSLDECNADTSGVFRITPCLCGDANGDCKINISDAVFIVAYIFAGGTAPGDCNYPNGMGDANGDGAVNISDAVYLICYIFEDCATPHCQGM